MLLLRSIWRIPQQRWLCLDGIWSLSRTFGNKVSYPQCLVKCPNQDRNEPAGPTTCFLYEPFLTSFGAGWAKVEISL